MCNVPLFLDKIACGFPSPTQDYVLDKQLIRFPESTYFLRTLDHSMKDAGILDGDLLIVECYNTANQGEIIITELDGKFTCKYLQLFRLKHCLQQIQFIHLLSSIKIW
ncbi:MAG TPA: S24 family peptidase [Arsenophonus sp.]